MAQPRGADRGDCQAESSVWINHEINAMNTDIVSIAVTVLAGAFLIAGWPLLCLRPVRRALLGIGGSGCVGLGSTVVALLAGGVMQLPTSALLAQTAESA